MIRPFRNFGLNSILESEISELCICMYSQINSKRWSAGMSKAILGIDVGKHELSVALLKDGKFTDKSVENNSKGFQKILKFSKETASKVEVYLEATGRY